MKSRAIALILCGIVACSQKNKNELKLVLNSSDSVLLKNDFNILSLAATSLSDLNCVGAVVGYKNIPNAGTCITSEEEEFGVTRAGGLVRYSSGKSTSLSVSGIKTGESLNVHVFGFRTSESTCQGMGPSLEISNQNMSHPYYIGSADLSSGSQTNMSVNIPLSFNSTKYLAECPSWLWADPGDQLSDELAAYFDFDNYSTDGTSFADYQSNFTLADPSGIIPYTTSKSGNGLDWNAAGYLTISAGDQSELEYNSLSDVKTYTFWYKYTGTAPASSVVAGVHGSTNGLSVGFSATGNLAVNFAASTAPTVVQCNNASCAASAASGVWVFYAVVVDPSNSILKFYVNGSFVQSNTFTPTLGQIHNNSDAFTIGADASGSSLQLSATSKLDMLGIWSRELSASEISTVYNSGSGMNVYSVINY